MTPTLDIRLKRPSKIYHEGESVSGIIVISCLSETRHDGIHLTVDGIVNLELSSKSVGQYESFYNSVKPIQLILTSFPVCKAGRLPAGTTEIPFVFELQGNGSKVLFETYHGVYVNIQYFVKVDMKRGLLTKDLDKCCEFVVEYSQEKFAEKMVKKPVEFVIVPETIQKLKSKYNIPKFKITGRLDSLVCSLKYPLTGEINIELCEERIKTVEVQLIRIETCGCAEGYSKDATEIQNIQIGTGNVMRNVPIPIHMVFPRLFTCPTLSTPNFKLEFEINISVVFEDNHLVSENFPIQLTRF